MSFAEMRRELAEIRDTAIRTEANVQWIRDAVDHQVTRGDRHDERLNKLETSHKWAVGFGTGVGAAIGAAFTWAATLLGVGGVHGIKQ